MTSCTEDITLELSSTASHLVVDGHLCDMVTPYNYVRLTMSTDYFSNQHSPAVSGAHVVVNDGEEDIILREDDARKGYYLPPDNFSGKHGRTYSLSITGVDCDHDGQEESYTATSPMPPTYAIDSVKCSYHQFIEHYLLGIYAAEDTTVSNFYMFGMAYNDSLVTDSYTKFGRSDDKMFDNSYCWGATVMYFDDDNIKGGIKEEDKVTLYALSVNEDFFDYVDELNDIVSGGSPMFSSTPANAKGNISNGALGFFTVFAVKAVECKVAK